LNFGNKVISSFEERRDFQRKENKIIWDFVNFKKFARLVSQRLRIEYFVACKLLRKHEKMEIFRQRQSILQEPKPQIRSKKCLGAITFFNAEVTYPFIKFFCFSCSDMHTSAMVPFVACITTNHKCSIIFASTNTIFIVIIFIIAFIFDNFLPKIGTTRFEG
jgi:hypothetical protein